MPLPSVRLTLGPTQPLNGEADAYISLRRFEDAIGSLAGRLCRAVALQFLRSDGAKSARFDVENTEKRPKSHNSRVAEKKRAG